MSSLPRPNFIGIGVPKAGTTWLHNLIGSHPNAYTPTMRKELHYFDRHYSKGEDWYLKFFKNANASEQVCGEITPHYLYDPLCPQRMNAFGVENILLVLRSPVERTWSNYIFKKRQDGYEGTITQFLDDYPHMFSWSNYADHIEQWQDVFGHRLHILIYEEIKSDHQLLCERLGSALSIDPTLFDSKVGSARVNAAFIPKRKGLYTRMVKLNKWLVDRNLDVVAKSLKSMPGAKKFVSKPTSDIRLSPTSEEGAWLTELYVPTVHRLETLIDNDLSIWANKV